jgi:hypothetical protein
MMAFLAGPMEGLQTLRRGLGVAQMAYPEVLDTVYILNSGVGFQWMWKIFSVRDRVRACVTSACVT